jgi:tmRNA-binding protein
MRFLADENISNRVIAGLMADGHDVASIRTGHPGLEDPSWALLKPRTEF